MTNLKKKLMLSGETDEALWFPALPVEFYLRGKIDI